MSEPTDPIDQAAQRVAEHAAKVLTEAIVRAALEAHGFAPVDSEAEVLQAIVQELRELKSTQRRVRELLERWDADGWPSTRVPE